MPVIAARGGGAYGRAMAAAALRLLTLIALVLMPVGMAGAPAMAQAAPVEHGMAMGHCDEMPGKEQAPPASKMDCAAMCTALPASFGLETGPMLKPEAPRSIVVSAPFDGVVPEIATPPPRLG